MSQAQVVAPKQGHRSRSFPAEGLATPRKGHVAVVDSNGGHVISYNSTFARKIQQLVQNEIVKEFGAIRL